MTAVRLEGLTKRFAAVAAVDSVDLTIESGEFVVLVGPSGSGKTTCLRMVAGLEAVTAGSIFIGDHDVARVHAKDRDVAMVFQSYALYPHMSVADNMGFALKLRKIPRDEIDRRIREVATILGIVEELPRKPKTLSGGQQQRVALGRAIVRDPAVFLFDEPLSNLDAKLRMAMRGELIKLHHRLSATMIYVTHDQTEAMTMGDRIVVMNEGRIQAERHTARRLRQSRQHIRRGLHRQPGDEPDRRRGRAGRRLLDLSGRRARCSGCLRLMKRRRRAPSRSESARNSSLPARAAQASGWNAGSRPSSTSAPRRSSSSPLQGCP